jgi:hypothetical protein
MPDSIKRYGSIVIVIATFIALAFFPIPSCFDCEGPNPYGLSDAVLVHRVLFFDIWSISVIFISVFLEIESPWLIPLGIMLADLMTQHLGGVPWWSLWLNEAPIIILVELIAGFVLLGLAYLFRICFDSWRSTAGTLLSSGSLAKPKLD